MTTPPTPATADLAGSRAAAAPVTGDGPVDEALALLATLDGDGSARDGQVLTAVHDALQHRLRATAEPG